MNYEQASAKLATARRSADGKPVDHNTRLFQRGDHIALRLHNTDIVQFKPNGDIVLNTGGWKTPTTKLRMNDYTPARISQSKGVWSISYSGATVLYDDMMVLKKDGTMHGFKKATEGKGDLKLRKQSLAYSKAFVAALFAGKVGEPGNGDCWGCLMKTKDGEQPMGGAGHIIEHFKESYFVPSLLVNALKEFGASKAMEQTAWAFMKGQKEYAFDTKPDGWIAKSITKNIHRHCLRQLGLPA